MPRRSNVPQQIYLALECTDKPTADDILGLYGMNGCNSISALHKKGKLKFLKTLRNRPHMQNVIWIFKNSDADLQAVANAKKYFLCALYGV